MSGSVDEEVVRMRFDNNAFERGVSTTINTLSKLKNSLSFSGADKGLDQIQEKASKFSLRGMSDGVDGISKKFSALSVVGVAALATLANKAVTAGVNIGKSFTTGPIKAGFDNYETQINAVQTILANTGLKGAPGLNKVNAALANLNTYANKTVYNFSEMAKNIGTFTAAGVKLQPATDAIKGIANLAALSGSSSDQASTAMYQLSQAIAANKVGLQDWNSVVNAGLGGKIFQQALFNTAKLQGTLKGVRANETFDEWTKSGNSFRNSLQKGWITGKVLTSTLSQFTGDLTDAQLKSQGYNASQIKQIQELAKTASGAATHIKTLSQLTDALKEEVATAYGAIFKTIFGDINGATTLFSGIHTVVENALTVPIYALNTLLQKTAALGGRAKAIDAFKNVFKALGAVLKPIKEAYRDIFPPTTAKQLEALIVRFDYFTSKLKIGGDTAEKIKRTFAGVFAVFDIGRQIVDGIFHVFANLFGSLAHGSGGFLSVTANIGDMVVAFDKALKQGGLIRNFFQIITNVLKIPVQLFGLLGTAIGQLFSGFHKKDASGLTNSVTKVGSVLAKVAAATGHIGDFFGSLSGKIQPAVQAVVHEFSKIGAAIAKGLGSASFGNVLKSINTGLLAAIVILIKKFFAKGINVDIGGGFLGKAGEALEGLTGNLKAMQTQLKAKALLEIAAAMGILALSLLALSAINPEKLASALKAMAVGFGELLGAMAILNKIAGSAGFVKIPLMAISLGILAGAILLLTIAVAALSRLSWQQLEKGLTGVGALLAGLSASSLVLSRNSKGMISAGLGIAAMAVGLNLLYLAVREFASMSWAQMLKGLSGVGIALAGIAVVMRAMPKGMIAQAAAIGLIAIALQGLYLAVKEFATLSYPEMLKGLLGVAGALVAIALAMKLMPKGILLQAIALIAVGGALKLIGDAVASMGSMSWVQIAKGLTALAGSLGVLAIALDAMTGSLGGAAALLVVSGALHLFVPALIGLASLSWSKILKGLGALALAFGVIGLSALLLTPVIPGILALGLALGAVGIAMLAFGAGAALLGIGLTAIAASGGAAVGVLLGALGGLIALLPSLATNLATALVSFIVIIGKNAPAIIGAFVSLLTELLNTVPKLVPSLVIAIGSLITALCDAITQNAPKVIKAGLTLLEDLLTGISNNIGKVTTEVADIIVGFLNALAANMPRIIKAGINLLTQFLVGIATALGQMPGIALKVVAAFLSSLFGNFGKIVSGGVSLLGKLISGIGSGIGDLAVLAVKLVGKFISGLASAAGNLAAAGITLLEHLLSGIESLFSSIGTEAYKIAKAIIEGIVNGIGQLGGAIAHKLRQMVEDAWDSITDFLGIGGPSKLACSAGEAIGQGFANGLDNNAKLAVNSARSLAVSSITAMKKTIDGLSSVLTVDAINVSPTITPVLDLTQVKKDAIQISGLVAVAPINASLSYDQASDIAASKSAQDADSAVTTPSDATTSPTISFAQYNTSPESLSTAEIYRRTNNQLSQAQKALGIFTPNP